jgi:hypothetical protein
LYASVALGLLVAGERARGGFGTILTPVLRDFFVFFKDSPTDLLPVFERLDL